MLCILSGAKALKVNGKTIGYGSGHFVLDDVECNGNERNLFECGHDGLYHVHQHCYYYRKDAGVECRGQRFAPPQNIETSIEGTTVSISWSLPDQRVQVMQFDIECSTFNQTIRTTVGNKTHTAQLSGLTSSTAYNCCVLAVFRSYSSHVCIPVKSTVTGSAYEINVVGGVLGTIIIFLLLLLALAIVASVYPCLIRPRMSKNKILTR